MSNFTAIILAVCSIVAVGFAAPVKYDQRQDGDRNFAAKVENVWVIVGIPSKPLPISTISAASGLADYVAMLNGPSPAHLDDDDDDDDDDVVDEIQSHSSTVLNLDENAEEGSGKPLENDDLDASQPEKPAEEAIKTEIKPNSEDAMQTAEKPSSDGAKGGRSLWSQIEEVVDNSRTRTSLKKELTWGQDVDAVAPARDGDDTNEQNSSNDHNEVGLITNHHYTLLGSAIEDCGPERQRNSYGICQPALSTE